MHGGGERVAEPKIGASAWNIKAYLKPSRCRNESAPVETRLKYGRHIPLFAALSWLRSPKVAFSVYFHWYVVCDLIGIYQIFMPPRDTWSLWPLPAFVFSPSSWNPHGRWGTSKQPGRCFSIQWSNILSPKYCYYQTKWTLIFLVWFATIICSLTVYAAVGNERMLMLWGEWTWIVKWQMNADCLIVFVPVVNKWGG